MINAIFFLHFSKDNLSLPHLLVASRKIYKVYSEYANSYKFITTRNKEKERVLSSLITLF